MRRRMFLGEKRIELFDILLASGKIVNESEYVPGTSAIGICFLIHEGYAHFVGLSDVASGHAYYGPNSAVGNGITSTPDSNLARIDYDGRKNMDAVIASGTLSNSPSFNLCNNVVSGILGKGSWYLPAVGELVNISDNYVKIKALLNKIGGTAFRDGGGYWSSTEFSATEGWYVTVSSGSLLRNQKTSTWTPGYVRPVTKIKAK